MGISSGGIKLIGSDIELNRARDRNVCDALKRNSLQINSEPQIGVPVMWLKLQAHHSSQWKETLSLSISWFQPFSYSLPGAEWEASVGCQLPCPTSQHSSLFIICLLSLLPKRDLRPCHYFSTRVPSVQKFRTTWLSFQHLLSGGDLGCPHTG